MNARRSKMRIFLDMLNSILDRGGKAKPTHILYGANLSHDRLKMYLEYLLEKDFVIEVVNEGRTYYQITEKGRRFVAEFAKIEELSKAFGISL